MATEDSNVSDLTIEILKSIREEMAGLRTDIQGVRSDLDGVRSDLEALKVETASGFQSVRAELRELAEFTQAGFKVLISQGDRRDLDHEGRLRRLAEHVGFPRR